MKIIRQQQSGFTLVEIAIVLVIIGLLLGGVLKGQEIIENSRMKSVVTDMKGTSAAFTGYFDRYRALPGDESNATATARGWNVGAAGGNANGVLGMPLNTTFTAPAGEQSAMWQFLRAANFISGDPTLAGVPGLPRSSAGGFLGATVAPYGLQGPSVCASGLSHKQAAGIDIIVDGALPATNVGANAGDLRGGVGANPLNPVVAPSAAAYNETLATSWTLCSRLQ